MSTEGGRAALELYSRMFPLQFQSVRKWLRVQSRFFCVFDMRNLFHVCVLQLLWTCLLTSGSDVPDSVTSTVGDDCDLPCSGPQGEVLVLQWIKDGRYLLLYRDDQISEKTQDQSFRGRVHLRDPELRRGDMTVTLKDLTLEDTGTYVCDGLVQTSGSKEERFTREVHLSVSERTEGGTTARTEEREGQDLDDQELRRRDTDNVTDTSNGNDLAVILGVTSAVAVVVCAVAAGVYWKINTIKDLPQKKKSPPLLPTPTPTSSNNPPTSETNPAFTPS